MVLNKIYFLVLIFLTFAAVSCQNASQNTRKPFAEAETLECPLQSRRVEMTNSSYPEYYCVGMDGRIGTWLQFDVNGRLRIRTEYKNDKMEGQWIQYHSDGSVDTQGTVSNDMRIGEWKQFYVNGAPRSIKHYENNQLHGHVQLFYQEGGLMAEGDYVSDFEEGPWKVYTPEGELARECRMVHGEEKDCVIHLKDFQPTTYHYNSKERGAL